MARELCSNCLRPLKACWCHCIKPISNQLEIGIWQHPTEVKQSKSSVPLLVQCLLKVRLWQGETLAETEPSQIDDFEMVQLVDWLKQEKTTYLLYPPDSEQESVDVYQPSSLQHSNLQDIQILVLDATWRKTYKMLMSNPELQDLPRIMLTPQQISQYWIRKQKQDNCLSSLEAVAEILTEIEQKPEIYQQLQTAFACFQQAFYQKSTT